MALPTAHAMKPSHLLMPNAHGLCVLSTPKHSELVGGDFIVGPGDLTDADVRTRLLAQLTERSEEHLVVTVVREGAEWDVSANRGKPLHSNGLYALRRDCYRVVRDVNREQQDAVRLREEFRAAARLQQDDERLLEDASSAHSDAPAEHVFLARMGEPRLFARRVGHSDDDPVIIVVNGGPGKSHDHMRVMEVLADRGWMVVTYDQRGTGP